MALYARFYTIDDVDRALAMEQAAFPPAEGATREKIEYRLTVCPELSIGLFLRAGVELPSPVPDDIPFITKEESSEDDKLLAHVMATRSTNAKVQDDDMAVPANWKADPQAVYDVGHNKNGRTISMHALATSPEYQRSGFGKAVMKSYIDQMKKAGTADKISILTYDRLVPYYQKIGFEHYGRSDSEYAGVAWHDLSYILSPA
ncbi:hypothetical protein NM208_g12556 [Fusarium decemcellulare]|uniref:Uncharacterized protein n=1 Tax=Fusarium decemcellulare TaxID=57161 RepID=A0ACC1RRQ4_9HYPO|nr:hypothetical protein NM208_g12556 [Fusarium decemcellulare]